LKKKRRQTWRSKSKKEWGGRKTWFGKREGGTCPAGKVWGPWRRWSIEKRVDEPMERKTDLGEYEKRLRRKMKKGGSAQGGRGARVASL